MNKKSWQEAFGPTSDAFRERVDDTLMRLEEREMRKRTKFSTALIAAALVITLLTGAAFAATQLNIWEALNSAVPIIPLEGADGLVSTDLATAENEYFRAIVQEGVYDGYGAIVKLRFEPKDPEKYVLLASFADPADVGDEYISEVVQVTDDGITDKRIIGRKDGKEIIFLSTPRPIISGENIDAEALGLDTLFNSYREKYNPDGSVEYWVDGMFAKDLPDTLNISLNVRGMDAEFNTAYGLIENLTFDLVKNNKERTVRLVPVSDHTVEGFELIDAKITFTEVRGYISVEYTGSAADADPGAGVSLRLLDAVGNEINSGSGYCTEMENGRHCWMLEMQSFEEIPKTMLLEAHIIGEDELGRIECRVEEITE